MIQFFFSTTMFLSSFLLMLKLVIFMNHKSDEQYRDWKVYAKKQVTLLDHKK
ncbi:hypothetical protein HBN50_11380 [Halobacteriovorax sp. GB3]|uniref:hypothetical protein n=1 Tax=Halobacteriovorax sp. GB3 TaxID=2719615 RepID=UPI00235F6D0D|nr:hypothetical protein [Halobacteriovorax sp. GB3]MDD0853702.1 hypothetical protein [Halobacteriovorax sp. GB3]